MFYKHFFTKENILQLAREYGNYLEIIDCNIFEGIENYEDKKEIETNDCIFKSKIVILATGAQPKKLNIKGEEEYKGRGVSYCAVCDGAFYKDKTVAVVGGGNSAVEEAIYLTKFAQKVYIIHRRDTLRADKIIQERAMNNPKIEFIFNSIPIEIQGTNSVESIIVQNISTKQDTKIQINGVFPYIGITPNTEMFNGQIKQNPQGFVETDENMQTSLKGVYAIGDVRNTPLRQVITAASDGAIAACSAVRYLDSIPAVTV